MFSIQLFNDRGIQYNTNGDNNYLIFELTMLADESPENVEFIPPSLGPIVDNLKNNNIVKPQKPILMPEKELEFLEKSTPITNINESFKIDENKIQSNVVENSDENSEENIETFENKEKDIYDELKDLFIENKITVLSITSFIIIFLFIFSKRK